METLISCEIFFSMVTLCAIYEGDLVVGDVT